MPGIRAAAAGCVSVVVVVSGLAACSQAPSVPPGNDQIKPSYNKDTGRLERITYDRNHDGKVDAWTVMDGTRVVRAELDENFDGRVDRWEYYDTGGPARPAAASSSGVLTRVETSSRDDGKVSRWEHYEKGQRVRAEEDTNGDGRVDRWETWEAGTLAAVTLDTDGDGRADRRMVYPADGSGPRFEVADGSGGFRPAR